MPARSPLTTPRRGGGRFGGLLPVAIRRRVQLVPHVVALRVLHLRADDHLAQEPRQERLRAEEEEEDAEYQQWATADRLSKRQFDDREVGQDQEADEEANRPQPAKKDHRSLREARDEHDGHEVQEAAEVAFQSELRPAVEPGAMVDHLLLDLRVALPLREERDVAVELAVDVDAPDDVRAVRLDATVEVVQRDATGHTGDPVEELRWEALLPRIVALLLPPAHEVGPRFQPGDHLGELGRVVLEIGVERGDVAARAALEPGGQGSALAVVAPEADAPKAPVGLAERPDHVPRVITGAVVDEPDLERLAVQRLADLVRQRREALGLVVDRDDDGELGAHGPQPTPTSAAVAPRPHLRRAARCRWWRTSRSAR